MLNLCVSVLAGGEAELFGASYRSTTARSQCLQHAQSHLDSAIYLRRGLGSGARAGVWNSVLLDFCFGCYLAGIPLDRLGGRLWTFLLLFFCVFLAHNLQIL